METADRDRLPAIGIEGRPGDYIAKSIAGEPIVLLARLSSSVVKPPLRLRHIEIDYGARCRIREANGASLEGEFTAILCRDVARVVQELFIRTVGALISTLPERPSPSDAEGLISGLVELFRKIGQPSDRSLKGLWAELFIIDRSDNIESCVTAWRGAGPEKCDFVSPGGYVEVKATEQPIRVHEFSLGQIRGPTSDNGLVASLLLRRATGGTGVIQLAQRIIGRLSDDRLEAKVWTNVLSTVGSDLSDDVELAFDERFADQNLAVIRAQDVPCVVLPLPVGVLDVRLTSDLTKVAQERNQGMSAISRVLPR